MGWAFGKTLGWEDFLLRTSISIGNGRLTRFGGTFELGILS